MKKINRILISASILLSTFSLNALTSNVSNFTATPEVLAIVDSSGTPLGISDSVTIGFFTDESAVATGDFSSFNQFGSDSADVNSFGIDGIISDIFNGTTAGTTFIGQNISIFIENSTNDEWLVAKTNILFTSDAGNPTASTPPINLFSLDTAGDITYLFGGADGPDIDYSAIGGGFQPSIMTAPVPEPSTYALFAGILSIGFVAVRRRRSRSEV